ncbi:hypothetical protein HYU17_05060 [Candidatus Woesearchaeota archaeon]|nr:hypothetical protein [Candidatus Woesearchaeota archaeon]
MKGSKNAALLPPQKNESAESHEAYGDYAEESAEDFEDFLIGGESETDEFEPIHPAGKKAGRDMLYIAS